MFSKILEEAINAGASDVHLTKNLPPVLRVSKELSYIESHHPLTEEDIKSCVNEILTNDLNEKYEEQKYADLSFEHENCRFRVHVYRQRSSDAINLRLIPNRIPTIEELNLPEVVRRFTQINSGLVLITGITGSGKSTTLASLIDEINTNQKKHIITIEDPVEFTYEHKKSIVTQKEVGGDVGSFLDAIKSAVREDPDVLLVGEMRDLDTIQNTITMAETGHLVFATLHTRNVVETFDRITDVFPSSQQQQIKIQLASVLEGVVSQNLLPKSDKGVVPACEVAIITDAIRSLIREQGQPSAIADQIQMNHKKINSQTYLQSIAALYNSGLITYETASMHTDKPEELKKMIMSVERRSTTHG